mmetsp:Transcript_30238/g.78186  ORF Transcript_30238/g.78186 Transcript_30238/m.78186 type:complete len:224 (+) Transcript_30238:1748-2419(+)
MVVVVAFLALHHDFLQKFHHATADEAGDDHAHREAMVGREVAPIVLICNQHVVGGVHSVLPFEAGAIGAVLALGKLLLWAAKRDVPAALRRPLGAAQREQVGQAHARPVAGAGARRTPVEADGLLHHVLLLPPVPRADQGHRNSYRRQGGDFVHSKLARLTHQALDGDPVLGPLDARRGAVVAHIVQAGGCHEAVLHEVLQRRLTVEGVPPRKAHEVGVAGHP